MAEEKKLSELRESLELAAKERIEKAHYQRELRGLEISAYSGMLQAFRASGKPNSEKEEIIKTLREYFDISEDRHKAEIRLLAFDNRLQHISKKLTGYDFTEEWAFQAQQVYVPLGTQPFSIFKSIPKVSNGIVIRDPVPSRTVAEGEDDEDSNNVDAGDDDDEEEELMSLNSDDSCSESELVDNLMENGWSPKKLKSLSIAVETGTGNEEEVLREHVEEIKKSPSKSPVKKQESASAKSPDITDAHRTTPIKSNEESLDNKEEVKVKALPAPRKPRGIKQKKLEDVLPPALPPPVVVTENSTTKLAAKKLAEKSKNIMKTKKTNRAKPKIKIHPKRSDSNKVRESSEETSSADEGENGPMPLDESSRVLSPVFSEVIRTSVLSRGGRGLSKNRSKGDRRRNNILNNPSLTKTGKLRANQKSAKLKAPASSGSRRKSKLNEKIDYDEVLINVGRSRVDRKRPPKLSEDPARRIMFENQIIRASEDCAVYTNSLPLNFIHDGMEQVTDGVFKRPLPPSRGPKPWEIKDARLNHSLQGGHYEEHTTDENIVEGDRYRMEMDSVHSQRSIQIISPPQQVNIMNDNTVSSTTPTKLDPPTKKQRIKSPLILNPSINSSAKVPLAPPVFSTSVSKKRGNNNLNNNNNKPISVVDSLNLHLPTSATASSLAASSSNRRPGAATGGGCSMFSNSSALIAGARGTAPGILQQQRKAQPHILSTSKAHQRTLLPPLSSPTNNITGNNLSIGGAPITITSSTSNSLSPTSVVPPGGQAVQITTTPIPISAISSVNPATTPTSFQNFSGSPPSNINLGPGMPLGHIGKSPAGTNIIFVQKANGPAVAGSTEVPSNMIPIKTQQRAVILRRAQLPRQGNVMILDMQKNQLVTPGQTAQPFLQTARVVNSQGEYSLVNIQPSSNSPVKTSAPSSLDASTTQTLPGIPQQQLSLVHRHGEETIMYAPNPESFITVSTEAHPQTTQVPSTLISSPIQITSTVSQQGQIVENVQSSDAEGGVNTVVVQGAGQDVQYAQIEAELMQMETGNFEEVVYEEEVTTEIVPLDDSETTQYIYASEEPANHEQVYLSSHSGRNHNLSITRSYSNAVTENEAAGHVFESGETEAQKLASVTKVLLSPTAESKLASEAISRALSLSKSTAKRLALTPPISLSTAATLANNLTISNKSHIGSEAIIEANSNQISIVPSMFQGATPELNPTAIVIEADPQSTNSIQSGKLQQGLEFSIHPKEIVQQIQPNMQGSENSS